MLALAVIMISHIRSGMDRPKTELPANKDKVELEEIVILQSKYFSSFADGSSQLDVPGETGDLPGNEQVCRPGGWQSGRL